MDDEVVPEVPTGGAIYLPDLCGNFTGDSGLFWDWSSLLETWQPSLPLCFETSVWVWWPCLVLWVATPLYLAWLRHPPPEKPTSLSGLARLKLALCVVTCIVCLVDGARRVQQTVCDTCTGVQGTYSYLTSFAEALTFMLVCWLTSHLCRRGVHSSGLLFVFWLTLTFTGAISLASDMLRPYYTIQKEDLATFVLFCTYYGLVILQFLLTLVPDPSATQEDIVFLEEDEDETQPILWHASTSSETSNAWSTKDTAYKAPCPEDNATFLSKITFFWLTRLLCRGYRRGTLLFEDLEDTPADEKTCPLVVRLQKHWQGYRRNYSQPKVRHLFIALLKTAWRPLVAAGVIRFLICFTTFFNPMLLQVLLSWLDSNDPYQWKGYAICVILLVANIVNSIITHVFFKLAGVTAMRVRTALTALVYRKSVRLSSSARQSQTVGSIVNLMSVDAQKVHDTVQDMHELWASPIMLTLTLAYLWTLLGPSCLAGLGFIMLLAPLNGGFLIRKFAGLQEVQMQHKDERIRLMTEILNSIKVIKMYAWEVVFAGRVEAARRAELDTVRFQAYIQASVGMVWYCTPFLVSLCVFTVYVLSSSDNFLDPQKAFVSINLFNTLNWSTSFIPIFLAHAAQAYISLGRLCQLLLEDELDDTAVEHDITMDPAIRIENASFSWVGKSGEKPDEMVERPITLKSVNLMVPEGSLTAIVGHVGCGKSSLVGALLGEMNKVQGSVQIKGNLGYVPQEPWIQNMSLRHNILFGRPLETAWYHQVLTACALTEDLQQLPTADRTEIGEKGITLSGGQRQRVSLARAVYQKRDIVIMDDTLSALDAHVARHVFDQVIGPQGLLKYKTRLLVTHHLSLLAAADQIIVLEEGQIAEVGTYEQLLIRQGTFARLLGDLTAARHAPVEKVSDRDSAVSSSSDTEGHPVRRGQRTPRRRRKSVPFGQVSMEASIQTHLSSVMGSSHQMANQGTLVEEETAQEGTISWRVLRRYVSAGGWLSSLAVVAFMFLYVGSLAATNIWLGVWADDPTDDLESARIKTRFRLSVYSILGVGQMLSVGVLSLAVYLGCLRASSLLHSDLLWRVLRAPLVIFHTTPMGRILNRFSVDIDKLDASLPLFTRLWLFNVAAVLSTVVIITYSTPIFLVAAVPIIIVYIIIQRVYIVSIRQLKRIDLIRRSPIFVHFNESLVGVTCVRAFQREQQFVMEADHLIDSSNIAWYPILIGQRWLGFILDILGALIVFFAALFAVLQPGGTATAGLAGLAVSFAMQISWSINMMVRGSAELETHVVSVERIVEYTELPQEPDWASSDFQPPPLWPSQGEVEFRNYSATYRPQLPPVLRQISLQVRAGEKLAVVGRTGAGKSSLALAMFRLIQPLGGALYMDAIDVATIGLHDLRGRVTIIPQEPSIFKGTLRWNLDPGECCASGELWQALDQVHLKDYVAALSGGLDYECGEGGQNLSLGQRQLVCLARALLRRSHVLVLDEVTASVDPETDALIQTMLRTQLRKCTVITIAHRLSTVRHYDRVCVMADGCIQELGTPDDLLQTEGSIFRALAEDAM